MTQELHRPFDPFGLLTGRHHANRTISFQHSHLHILKLKHPMFAEGRFQGLLVQSFLPEMIGDYFSMEDQQGG